MKFPDKKCIGFTTKAVHIPGGPPLAPKLDPSKDVTLAKGLFRKCCTLSQSIVQYSLLYSAVPSYSVL